MTKRALLIVLVLAAPAVAADSEFDNIGLFMDPEDRDSYCDPDLSTGTYRIYVLGTELSSTSVKGCEFKLSHFGAAIAGPLQFAPGFDFGSRAGEHIIAFYDPQPVGANGQFVFAEYDLAVLADDGIALGFMDHIYFHSLPEEIPAYLDGADLNLIKPLSHFVSSYRGSGYVYPALVINGDCVVANEDVGWGEIKALYR